MRSTFFLTSLFWVTSLACDKHGHHHHHHDDTHQEQQRRNLRPGPASIFEYNDTSGEKVTLAGKEFKDLDEFQHSGGICGSPDPSAGEEDEYQRDIASYLDRRRGRALASETITIPVYFHVIRESGSGELPNANRKINDSVMVLNNSFRDSNFQFTKAGTTTTFNTNWYRASMESSNDQAMRSSLRQTAPGYAYTETLNVYMKSGAGNLGWANFPQSSTFPKDGVVIDDETVPGGNFSPYNEGDTLVHEVSLPWYDLNLT